jgi:transporter family-2 protein
MIRYLFALGMVVVAGVSAMQPPINAALARRTGGLGAAAVSFLVGFVALMIAAAISGNLKLPATVGTPWWIWTGGLLGAAFVYSSILLVPHLGAAGLMAAVVTGQLVGGLLADHFGWFGLSPVSFTWTRAIGFVLLLAGVGLLLRR